MKTYMMIKIGQFKSITDTGNLSKTYVSYGKDLHTISVKRYALCPIGKGGGWYLIKRFKNYGLYKSSMHFHVESFMEINLIVSKFFAWNTEVNQQK